MNAIPEKIHLLKLNNNQVLGINSVAFGFKKQTDAFVIRRLIRNKKNALVWHTKIQSNKFMILATQNERFNENCYLTTENVKEVVNHLSANGMTLRIIDSVEKEEDDIFSLYSHVGIDVNDKMWNTPHNLFINF